jgi:hypothetical protein
MSLHGKIALVTGASRGISDVAGNKSLGKNPPRVLAGGSVPVHNNISLG